MKEGSGKKRGRRSFEERVEDLRRASESIHSYPGHIFTRIHLRHILSVTAAILISLTAVGAFKSYKTYAHYAAIVDTQLDQRLLQRHGGVYSAPRQVRVEQLISRNELRERLLRAGYQQARPGTPDDQFSSGSFFFEGDEVKLSTNEFARAGGLPESVKIKFDGRHDERIVKIENAATGRDLKSAALPPELLTVDGATGMHPRSPARFDEFPPALVNALIAIEDRNFFLHSGVDVKAVIRAMWENWRHGEIREGGSTITQQLIKTNFLTPERTYQRKFAEAMMAMALERRLSKEKIFALYANRVYLGQSGFTAVYGFKQAARVFFGKDLHELSLAESALIAGLAQAPNRYSPYQRPDMAVARRNAVLDAMVETDWISADEAEAAKSERLLVRPPVSADESAAQHFVDYVKRELASRNTGAKDDPNLEIQTTLDLDLQQAANIAVKNYLSRLDRIFNRRPTGAKTRGHPQESALPEAALIAIDPHTGEILAMVGGRDYASSQLNRVTDARRQPGSIFKPIVYATALANGISPETMFIDAPHEIVFGHEIYRPQNYGGGFSNQPVTLREGIVRSLNVVAVDAAIMVGLRKVAALAEKMGLPRPEPYPSMALGAFEATPFEIAKAYSTFANGGVSVSPFGIKSVRNGDVTDEMAATKTGVLRASSAYIVTDTLAEAVDRGTATRVRAHGYQGPAAGKTGTSRDSWFAGYTPKLLVVVWVGFDDHRNLKMTGNDAAAPIWTDFVKRALALRPDLRAEKFTPPTGMEQVEIDPQTGMLATENCPSRKRVMIYTSKMPPRCTKHPSYQALQADQNRSAARNSDSALSGATRRRSVKRTRPATASDKLFQPMTHQDQLAPALLPPIIRRQGQ
jgi:penicillin-binding protein 1B